MELGRSEQIGAVLCELSDHGAGGGGVRITHHPSALMRGIQVHSHSLPLEHTSQHRLYRHAAVCAASGEDVGSPVEKVDGASAAGMVVPSRSSMSAIWGATAVLLVRVS